MQKTDLNNENNAKVALVTGASRGLGASIAITLAKAGYDIWVNYSSNTEAANRVRDEITALGRNCKLLQFDVRSKDAIDEVLVPEIEKVTPHVLVNNAGFTKDALMIWMSQKEWEDVIDVSLLGFFLVTKTVLMGMLKRKSGRIINITSTAGQSGQPGQANYSAAKAGLMGATKSLALEVCKKGVIVNAVAPGFIETDMTKNLPADKILPTIPAGRFGRAEEVAGVVEFLCSDKASYIIGETISINGGIYT